MRPYSFCLPPRPLLTPPPLQRPARPSVAARSSPSLRSKTASVKPPPSTPPVARRPRRTSASSSRRSRRPASRGPPPRRPRASWRVRPFSFFLPPPVLVTIDFRGVLTFLPPCFQTALLDQWKPEPPTVEQATDLSWCPPSFGSDSVTASFPYIFPSWYAPSLFLLLLSDSRNLRRRPTFRDLDPEGTLDFMSLLNPLPECRLPHPPSLERGEKPDSRSDLQLLSTVRR